MILFQTRQGYSKIEVCCSGYSRTPHTYLHCEPQCDGCENGKFAITFGNRENDFVFLATPGNTI